MAYKIITYTCKDCEKETKVEVTEHTSARTYGPPESCSPDEGGEIIPTNCEHCNKEIDNEDCQEQAFGDNEYD